MTHAADTPGLEVRLLGEPEVVVDGRIQRLPASKKTRALLGYLVATGRPQRRDRLCELLWDGPDDPRAGLRWSLAKLRPLLDGAERIVADRERVGFDAAGADIDVHAVRALEADGLAQTSTEALAAAAARFRGPFLEGLELSSCPAFHAWCVAEREALRGLEVGLLTTLIDRHRAEPARALGYARALVALDPLAESPRLILLDVLAALGEARRALEEYESYARILRRELGVRPSLQLEQRRMALTSAPGAAAPAGPDAPASAAAARAAEALEARVGAAQAPDPAAPAFVGRSEELGRLARLLDAVGHGTPVLLVLGEPGIGKTRLLEELGRLARERGGRVLVGRAFEAELVRPYGAFIDALRGGCEPRPETSGGAPAPFAERAADRARLYDVVLEQVAGLAAASPPLLLLLDDLHWFDEASAELFHFLARALTRAPVLLAASARAGELADNPAAQRLVRALGRERLAVSLELGPLADEALRALVGLTARSVAFERVLHESAGNPLFALEAARAFESGSQDLVGSLAQLIGDRLGRLQEGDRSLLSWAAALGRSFDVDVLARVSGLTTGDLLAALERLERHAVLRGRESGYDFAHDLLRQAAYRQMSSPRRRLVHAQIARALATGADPEGALAAEVAHHAALGGDATLAARACIDAGRRCLRLFATREARDLARRGRSVAARLPAAERLPLWIELLAIEIYADPSPSREKDLLELADEARALGLSATEARAFYLKSLLHFRADEANEAFESAMSRVEATRHSDAPELGVQLAGAARCCLMLGREIDKAVELVARSRSLLGGGEVVDLLWAEGLLAAFENDLDTAARRLERALSIARRRRAHWEACECLLELAFLKFDRGDHEGLLRHAAELLEVERKLGEGAYAFGAAGLSALSRARDRAELASGGFEESLPPLRAAGASRILARLLNRAAEAALRAGLDEQATRHATEALAAAERVERVNEIAWARLILAELAGRAHDEPLLRRHLDALPALLLGREVSPRWRRAALEARARLDAAAPGAKR